MTTIKTVLHYYNFYTDNEEAKEKWRAFKAEMEDRAKNSCAKLFHAHSVGDYEHYRDLIKPLDGVEITLSTKHVFSDQWTALIPEGLLPGVSAKLGDNGMVSICVFDWTLRYNHEGRYQRMGHWLEETEAMRAIRDNTWACGYCGRQERALPEVHIFCPACIDSEYLDPKTLYLTRMQAVSNLSRRPELEGAELAARLALYKKSRIEGVNENGKADVAKRRQGHIDKCDMKEKNARTERDGFLWLMDRGIPTSNFIYYHHTDTFALGWRVPITDLRAEFKDLLKDFPFTWEFSITKSI